MLTELPFNTLVLFLILHTVWSYTRYKKNNFLENYSLNDLDKVHLPLMCTVRFVIARMAEMKSLKKTTTLIQV